MMATAVGPVELAQSAAILLGALGTFFIAVSGLVLQIFNFRASLLRDQKLKEVHDLVDGQSAALNSMTAQSAFAEGKVAGVTAVLENTQPDVKK